MKNMGSIDQIPSPVIRLDRPLDEMTPFDLLREAHAAIYDAARRRAGIYAKASDERLRMTMDKARQTVNMITSRMMKAATPEDAVDVIRQYVDIEEPDFCEI